MHESLDRIYDTIKNPLTVRYFDNDPSVRYSYRVYKEMDYFERYLLVAIKYLNNHGFVITSFFTDKIKGLKWQKT